MDKSSKIVRSLAPKKFWDSKWSSFPFRSLPFNPRRRNFRDLHGLFLRNLPRQENLEFLEIGCYPGRYLWYFNKYFGYQVSGMDYIDWCCRDANNLLKNCGVQGEIIQADIFSYEPASPGRQWDIVASFGFIEHFENSREAVKRHLELLKPGGFLVLVVPNHQGIYGKILKKTFPEIFRAHRIMSRETILKELQSSGEIEIVEEGYYGRLGFGHTGLVEKLMDKNPFIYHAARVLVFGIENTARILPRSAALSPYIAVIARNKNHG